MSKLEKNLSQGNVATQLIKFALPFVGANLLQATYAMADMIIVGQFADHLSMSGVNIGSQITTTVTNAVMGLAAAATILVGQFLGNNDRDSLKKIISSLFSLLLILGGVLMVAIVTLHKPILHLIETPPDAFSEASYYLIITGLGILFVFAYNALSAVMRGMGNSKSPLLFVAIACGINIALDLLFVAKLGMGARGAALATIIAQAISVILCIAYLKRHDFVVSFDKSLLKPDKEKAKLLIRTGLPLSLQNTCVSISFMVMLMIVNKMDSTAIYSAALGAVGKFNNFGVMPAFAMSAAISAMCAQNLGAGQQDRAIKTLKTGMAISFSMCLLVFLFCRFFSATSIKIFKDDPDLIAAGTIYLKSFSWDYIIVCFSSAFNGLFIAAGHTRFTMVSSIVAAIAGRIPACYLFGVVLDMGLFGVGLGAPVASGISLVLGLIYYRSGIWKRNQIINHKTQ